MQGISLLNFETFLEFSKCEIYICLYFETLFYKIKSQHVLPSDSSVFLDSHHVPGAAHSSMLKEQSLDHKTKYSHISGKCLVDSYFRYQLLANIIPI